MALARRRLTMAAPEAAGEDGDFVQLRIVREVSLYVQQLNQILEGILGVWEKIGHSVFSLFSPDFLLIIPRRDRTSYLTSGPRVQMGHW